MKTILVDDMALDMQLLELKCADMPEIEIVGKFTDPLEAVAYASTQEVEFAMLDIDMPGMNGIELITEVRKLAAYKFMPILFLTTESQQSRKMEAKAAGASGWIVKPATADELLSTIKLVIR